MEKAVYRHQLNGCDSGFNVGKAVCVGRNYVAHAKELNNPVPTEPLLFIKSAITLVSMEQPFVIPKDKGACHFEVELAVLVGKQLSCASVQDSESAIAGVGLALDLTLRDVQQSLKEKGHPWEKAKSFDGACPVSGFVSDFGELTDLPIRLWQNGQIRQDGNTAEMITPVLELLSYASSHFTLMPGDIVLTGTPAGVGELSAGDQLVAELGELVKVETSVS